MINLAELKQDLYKEVTEHNDIRYCFNCSTCISGCPASEANPPLLIRNLVRKVLLGQEDALLDDDSPWACVTCSKCEEMCPMGVKPFELCLAIRRWQCRNDETRIPQSLPELFERGYTQPVEKAQALRASVGLGELSLVVHDPELLKRFQAMLKETKIVKENSYMFKE
ncbi:MAG: 4Fe-4S dicluster domain-containing protein [Deltaproteobacteria bacterium]|nr:4Fe-4S dicluster domain-containing protein [Deltaproteobacteria bacterium]